ncbi:hypothetical protein V8G54_025942 [Vigna mungo]|uniref:Tf2-1-like SH3-like domain-containing protein n=1 Tax=Vigna mungo TaxID=3915 RepID=A0AAQ3MYP0_VIGMU
MGHTVILVVVDRFSKGTHFGTLPNHFTAFRVAQLFMDMVCKHHGIPRSLVSDRFTPFQVTYGKSPPSIPFYLTGSSSVETVDTWLTNRQTLMTMLRKKLEKAQLAMKTSADRHRRDVVYQMGDWVYVRLRPYRQRSLHSSFCPKLAKRFYGPFRITARIGPVAYKLDLPPTSRIHPVFHCSLLKLHKGPLPSVPAELPPIAQDNKPLIEPLAVLDTKMDVSTDPPTKLALVQWKGLAPEDTSWEVWSELVSDFHLEDKVPPLAVGIDSNSPVDTGPIVGSRDDNREDIMERPKRGSKLPSYLKDYVTN